MSTLVLTPQEAETVLGKLIFMLNPYTKGQADTATIGNGSPGDKVDLGDVRIQVDDYEGHWSFKGNDQRIKKALRIEYRYKMDDAAGNAGVLATEYLLIGYAGSGGGE
jgi:hypothetical protein